jgi:hypothetical protein
VRFTAFVGKQGRTPDVDARGWSGGSDVAEPPWPGATKSIVPPPPSVVAEEDAGHAAADAPSALAVVLAALAVRTLYRSELNRAQMKAGRSRMESAWGSTADAAHVGRRHAGRAGTANVPTIQCEARRVALRALALLPAAALALALGHTVAALRLGQTAADLRPKETTRSSTSAVARPGRS